LRKFIPGFSEDFPKSHFILSFFSKFILRYFVNPAPGLPGSDRCVVPYGLHNVSSHALRCLDFNRDRVSVGINCHATILLGHHYRGNRLQRRQSNIVCFQ